jgi:sugar phosphate isomerase/epimerase
MSFKYCLNASTIKTTPVLEQIAAAASAGFEAVELWHDKIDEYLQTGGKLRDIRVALNDCGLAVPTTIYISDWFDASDDAYPAVLDKCKRRMHQAAEIGAPYVIASPPRGRADIELGGRRYLELLRIGESLGVMPAMEFLGFVDQLNTIEAALKVMDLSGHPAATTVLDPFHVFRGGGSMESITKLTASRVAISHFNDAPASPPRAVQGDHDRVMPGDGHLDLTRYLQLLRQIGYNHCLSLELFREELWQADPIAVAKRGLMKMQMVVEADQA